MLGIGVDEGSALIVHGSTAKVMGKEAVSFYDPSSTKKGPEVLREGERYDLAKRAAVR